MVWLLLEKETFTIIMFTIEYNEKHIWLTHLVRMTHKCVSNLTIIGSDNGLSASEPMMKYC